MHAFEANTPFEKLPGTQINVPRLNLHKRPRPRQCPTSRDFVPWRFLDAGLHSVWKGSSCRRPKTLYGAYWCQGESVGAVESFCHVTRLHLRHGQPLARLRRAVKPQSRLRRAEGAGLDGECAVRAIIIVAATYKGHSALFEALWIAIVGTSPFTDMSNLAA